MSSLNPYPHLDCDGKRAKHAELIDKQEKLNTGEALLNVSDVQSGSLTRQRGSTEDLSRTICALENYIISHCGGFPGHDEGQRCAVRLSYSG